MGRHCSTLDHTSRPDIAAAKPTDRLAGRPEPIILDPDKAFVMGVARDFVRRGAAQWTELGDGDIELQLASGEIFILGERTVKRIR
jgi:hypothetical protein